ncbi:MAG: NAD(+)/NADH kinase, partial [Anaerolineae bacterium]|nr:NAD(+)/NADH kinase [Anaerolineae bacterium]
TCPRAVRRVGILTHPRVPETETLAADLVRRFAPLGVAAEVASSADPRPLQAHLESLDCLITLGGDGSIVRAARAIAGYDVPILGVNLGQLGFLAELQPSQLEGRLEALARGEYRVEERRLLSAELTTQEGCRDRFLGLNDAVVARGEKVRAIAVAVWVDGQLFTTYRADGVIVSTATGSTAYSLAVGGPILAPTLDCLSVIPVAPHLVPTRALVVSGTSAIRLQVAEGHRAVLSIDGQIDRSLAGGDAVDVTLSPGHVGLVRFGPPADFYGTLFRRLRWATHNR